MPKKINTRWSDVVAPPPPTAVTWAPSKLCCATVSRSTARTPAAEPPLHYAVMKTHRPVARLLLERGAAVDHPDGDGRMPLHLAAEKDDPQLLRLVLARASSPDLAGADGNTPLHYAAGWGRLDNVRLLLAASARPSVRNKLGQTAFQIAEKAGRKRVAELLRDLDQPTSRSTNTEIR